MQKLQSRFRRLLGPSAVKGVEFEGLRWEVGKGEEYPLTLHDLIYFYPLVVKHFGHESLAVSLPVETYLKSPELRSLLADRIYKHAGARAEVYPQGVISLKHLYGENLVPYDEKVLVIDGGFNTVNLSVVKDGEVLYVKTFYNELGVRDLLDKYFREELLRRFPEVAANLQKLQEVFLAGVLDIGFYQYDLSEVKRIATEVYLNELFNRIKGELTRVGESFTFFVVVGGLSYLLKGIEIETNKGNYIPEENGEFLTALGMHYDSGLPAVDFGFGQIKEVSNGRL